MEDSLEVYPIEFEKELVNFAKEFPDFTIRLSNTLKEQIEFDYNAGLMTAPISERDTLYEYLVSLGFYVHLSAVLPSLNVRTYYD